VIHWVKSDRQVVLTYTAAILIADLWAAGRFRYVVAAREDGFRVVLPKVSIDDLLRADEARSIVVDEMAVGLPYLVSAADAAG